MKTMGIRIFLNDILRIKLSDVLAEIPNGDSFLWSILFIDGTPNPGQGKHLAEYKNQINESEDGLRVEWKDLFNLSSQFYQIFEIIVLGNYDVNALHRYKNETEMYKTCAITIELIDCTFWEIYAKNQEIISNLSKKFPQFEFLEI